MFSATAQSLSGPRSECHAGSAATPRALNRDRLKSAGWLQAGKDACGRRTPVTTPIAGRSKANSSSHRDFSSHRDIVGVVDIAADRGSAAFSE
ncbi:MAG: hypothetical protein RIB97_13550 [Nitratireductor sp.]